jgi:hypothetical protein
MGRVWVSVAGRIGVACAAGAVVALGQGSSDVAFGIGLMWGGAALGVLLTLIVVDR